MSAPAAILTASRVDLVALIRNGIPEPAYVPGGEPWLRKGKRYLIPAPAGAGKSLAALVVAVTVVEHGGTAVVLDVENGSDEYARRLEDILGARDVDGELTAACRERLRYHDWPRFSLTWTPEAWAEAINGADLVIFDSSRLSLSSVGLTEDSNDDYASFMSALVVPLAKAGSTTMVLDNTGHDGAHARGASAKGDLNEVVYALTVGAEFDQDKAGHVRLTRKRERFSGLPRAVRIDLGGNTYSAPAVTEVEDGAPGSSTWEPTGYMERVSRFVENEPGCSARALRSGVSGKGVYVDRALTALIRDRYVERRPDGKTHRFYSVRAFTE